MSHDRARLSALVDGELDHDARDRVLAHLAQCDECRAVVETERRVKSLLSGMPEASPGGDFLARLNSLGDPSAAPVVEPPAPAKRRIVGRGRSAGSKHSGATQPMPPTAPVTESGRPSVGTLQLGLPPEGAPPAGDGIAAALETGVLTPGGYQLGVLRAAGQPTEALATGTGDAQPGELSADETTTAEVRTGEPYAAAMSTSEPGLRRSRRPFSAPSRPAASRPFGYPDLHGSRRPGRLRGVRLHSSRLGRRFTVGVAGAASLAGMALVTAFTVGGATAPTTADVKVVPPIQRYTVQHADSAVNLPYSDPGGATASIGDSNLTGLLSPNR
ncbi:anti-sigma factor family protein [Flindersiella endophytica]